ncbi:MAG TPA: hypothetical protein VFM11_04900 [Burkholderiales bacterium]|nr:hypothetical protein [Burkholderiales bacterium]
MLEQLSEIAAHPLADAVRARGIISGLPADDPATALEEVTFWLGSVSHADGFHLDARFASIDLLDAAARQRQHALLNEYLVLTRNQIFQENRVWTVAYNFWKQLGHAYLLSVDLCAAGAIGGQGVRDNLPQVVARAVNALGNQLKWLLLRYSPIDERIWEELFRMYQFAEEKEFHNVLIELHPGSPVQTSVKRELLKALMLAVSSTDSLVPASLETAAQTIAYLAPAFAMEPQPAGGCGYAIDLDLPRAPWRTLNGRQAGSALRYFGPGRTLVELDRLLDAIRTRNELPHGINFDVAGDPADIAPIMRHLRSHWADAPRGRRTQRRPTATRLTVVGGLHSILHLLDPRNPLPVAEDRASESWIVENVSDSGFGAIVPLVKGEWVRVGSLVGIKPELAKYWGIGIIRRIGRDQHRQLRTGIEALSQAVIPVRIARAEPTSSAAPGADFESALLLSTTPDASGEVTLLLRKGLFDPAHRFEMEVRNKHYLLMPSRQVEAGEDFDRISFRIAPKNV